MLSFIKIGAVVWEELHGQNCVSRKLNLHIYKNLASTNFIKLKHAQLHMIEMMYAKFH